MIFSRQHSLFIFYLGYQNATNKHAMTMNISQSLGDTGQVNESHPCNVPMLHCSPGVKKLTCVTSPTQPGAPHVAWCRPVQGDAAQGNTVQRKAARCSTRQHGAAQGNMVQRKAAPSSIWQHRAAFGSIVQLLQHLAASLVGWGVHGPVKGTL